MIKNDEYFMGKAIEIAKKSRKDGNEPFGAILVKDYEIVMIGENKINTLCDPTHHAEIGLIRQFCLENNIFDLCKYILYTSCEPCVMCSGAMVWANLGKLVYSVSHDQLAEIAGSNIMISCSEVFEKSPNKPVVIEKVLNNEGLEVFDGYKF
ncbi:nucleoside deaminase [Clostridium tagluense]|uniref:nucleoside deaminase n=1 Tax=Clostridium tagluense TaxID=360422 RepID=UPI001C0D600A|nr:nucleoside deaminase [Clostridium tagluense]MBU3127848.1 nucleoside deaminase [Clostridium tagluense]MCB2300760.1 nucleoside deaminase [Clostridium tagluense]MCB2310125.1 nucleoside deaminase [Clostridium tagluense]MCB2315233.1 nucleoside deaminase [Clostridium tagluense]MCB2319825.1 nucleoside deaminase [Clostridium tagluense]